MIPYNSIFNWFAQGLRKDIISLKMLSCMLKAIMRHIDKLILYWWNIYCMGAYILLLSSFYFVSSCCCFFLSFWKKETKCAKYTTKHEWKINFKCPYNVYVSKKNEIKETNCRKYSLIWEKRVMKHFDQLNSFSHLFIELNKWQIMKRKKLKNWVMEKGGRIMVIHLDEKWYLLNLEKN